MLRVAVISDTHANLQNLSAVTRELGPVDWLIHAGDHLADMPAIARTLGTDLLNCRGVLGNCDYPASGPLEDVLELGGVRLLVTHGHGYGVKTGLKRLFYRACELGASGVIFGHTHIAVKDEVDSVLLFNPGSLSEPRRHGDAPSCGLLEIDDGRVQASHIFVRGIR